MASADGSSPKPITRLENHDQILAMAKAYQDATDHHLRTPDLIS